MSRSKKQKHFFQLDWKKSLRTAVLIVILLSVFLSINHLKNPNLFPIKNVKVYGIVHVDPSVMQHSLKPFVRQGFFGVEVAAIKEQVLINPWVSDANVRRVWPDQIEINIQEKTPIARWNTDALLSETGDLFVPDDLSALSLPDFIGPSGKQFTMMDNFNKINSLLAPLHFKVVRLVLTDDNSWTITLDNGLKIAAGNKDILTRITHFVKVYPKIAGNRLTEMEYVDLRYTNGLAVKWKA